MAVLLWAAVGSALGIGVMLIITGAAGRPLKLSTFALGALFGPVFSIPIAGFTIIKIKGLLAVVTFIAVSPLMGMAVSFLMGVAVTRIAFRMRPNPVKANRTFRLAQIFSSSFYSFNHGINDAQKTVGVLMLLLVAGSFLGKNDPIPMWVAFGAFGAIGLGTFVGGWRIVKTMATKITALKPYQGFCAETAGGGVLMGMALGGVPVSTTHAIAGSIMGVGAVNGLSAVKWGMTRRLVGAWLITIPASAAVAAVSYLALRAVVGP